jgi:hypothetical protein
MLSWNSQAFAPEFLRNEHSTILVLAVILRSIVFAALVANAFRRSNLSFKPAANAARRFVSYLKLFKDKWLVLAASAMIVIALIGTVSLYVYVNGNTGFRSLKGTISVTQSEWQSIAIDDLEKGDQVMIRLATGTWLDAELANSTVQVERGFRNPYNLKDSFNETMLFFRADSEQSSLMLRMKHSQIPFRITEGLENDLSVNATEADSTLTLRLKDAGIDGNASMFTMAYPISARVDHDFSLHLRYRLIEGNGSNIWVYVFDDTDEWLYPFAASEDFVLTPQTKDLYGRANLLGDNISLVEVSMLVDDNASAVFRLEEFSVSDGEKYNVEFYAMPNEEIPYEVFVERDFKPSISYVVALISTVALSVFVIWYLYRKVKYG